MKPRTVVLDLFGDHLRYLDAGAGLGAVRLQALTELLEVFGVGDATARVVLARMRREGFFDTVRDGRQTVYSLTERSWRLLDDGRPRIFERTTTPWDGAWRTVIYAVPEADRAEREQVRRTLSWLGFGPLASSTWVSPHDRLDDVADALADRPAVRLDLLTSRARDRMTDRVMAARCWDLAGLGRDYAELVTELEQLPTDLTGPEALRAQVDLLARWRSFPFRDPDLPAELLPDGWPGVRAHRLFVAAHAALRGPAHAMVRAVVQRHA